MYMEHFKLYSLNILGNATLISVSSRLQLVTPTDNRNYKK